MIVSGCAWGRKTAGGFIVGFARRNTDQNTFTARFRPPTEAEGVKCLEFRDGVR